MDDHILIIAKVEQDPIITDHTGFPEKRAIFGLTGFYFCDIKGHGVIEYGGRIRTCYLEFQESGKVIHACGIPDRIVFIPWIGVVCHGYAHANVFFEFPA